MEEIRACRRAAGQGGLSLAEVKIVAKRWGILVEKQKKDDLCNEIAQAYLNSVETYPTSNQELADQMFALSKEFEYQGDTYRAKGMAKNAAKLAEHPTELFDQPEKISTVVGRLVDEGFSGSVIERVIEYLTTRNLAELQPPEDRPWTPQRTDDDIVLELRLVSSIGPAQARMMVRQGILGLKDLLEKYEQGLYSDVRESTIEEAREVVETLPEAELGRSPAEIADELVTIYGIGPAKARSLVSQGILGRVDLQERMALGQNFGLSAAAEVGLAFYDDLQLRIPRREVQVVGEAILQSGHNLDPEFMGEIVGSYRRGAKTSGDVDLLLSARNGENYLADLVRFYQEDGFLVHIFSFGLVKFAGTYYQDFPYNQGHLRQIDLRFVPPRAWATALLHSTGSDAFNRDLRSHALNEGYTLSEHGLFDLSDPRVDLKDPRHAIPIDSEEAVFEVLGLEYVPPTSRNPGDYTLTRI